MPRGGIFVINRIILFFYVTESKAVPYDRLRKAHGGIFVINSNVTTTFAKTAFEEFTRWQNGNFLLGYKDGYVLKTVFVFLVAY